MLYKYRSLQNFKNLTDIFVNSRMYAAPYLDLNDPMEGHYLYSSSGELDTAMQNLLKGEKEKLRILSLSRRPDIALMWAHYAEGCRGVCIGVKIDAKYDIRPINYNGPMILNSQRIHANSAIEVLSRKLEVWQYEQEERIFVTQGQYVSLSVKEVILGSRMSNQDKSLVKNLVGLLLPYVKVTTQD